MKRLIYCLAILIGFCSTSCNRTYLYVQTDVNEYGIETIFESSPIEFKAADDSSAARWGRQHLKKEQENIRHKLFAEKITSLPYSFTILNADEETVVSFVPTFANEHKAYREAYFGMTIGELMKLNMFTDKQRVNYPNGSLTLREKIGDDYYYILFELFEGELYQVVIDSDNFQTEYNRHILDIQNLLNVFLLSYELPYYSTPIPTEPVLREEQSCIVARWKVGGKQVSIASTYHQGYGYAVMGTITNAERHFEKYKKESGVENEILKNELRLRELEQSAAMF